MRMLDRLERWFFFAFLHCHSVLEVGHKSEASMTVSEASSSHFSILNVQTSNKAVTFRISGPNNHLHICLCVPVCRSQGSTLWILISRYDISLPYSHTAKYIYTHEE